jgi:hypothetical protein
MRWILDLGNLLLVSGTARKHGIVPKPFLGCPQYFPPHGIMPKPFLGCPQYFPPPQKSIFFQEQEISREREFVASQIGNYKKIFLIMQTNLGGQSYYPPPFNPLNPVASWALGWEVVFFLEGKMFCAFDSST